MAIFSMRAGDTNVRGTDKLEDLDGIFDDLRKDFVALLAKEPARRPRFHGAIFFPPEGYVKHMESIERGEK